MGLGKRARAEEIRWSAKMGRRIHIRLPIFLSFFMLDNYPLPNALTLGFGRSECPAVPSLDEGHRTGGCLCGYGTGPNRRTRL